MPLLGCTQPGSQAPWTCHKCRALWAPLVQTQACTQPPSRGWLQPYMGHMEENRGGRHPKGKLRRCFQETGRLLGRQTQCISTPAPLLAWNSLWHEGFLALPIRWIVRTWQESPLFIQFSDSAYSCPVDWNSPVPLLLCWTAQMCWSRE